MLILDIARTIIKRKETFLSSEGEGELNLCLRPIIKSVKKSKFSKITVSKENIIKYIWVISFIEGWVLVSWQDNACGILIKKNFDSFGHFPDYFG